MWTTFAAGTEATSSKCSTQAVYTSLKLHVERDEEVRGVIAAVNDAVELRSFQEIIPSMNDIFIRAVNGNL